jgi:type I restriction enzyme, S subunit
MRADMLFENFEMLSEAPGGVPKLRETILQLAVQGKLVPQDLNDEPASILLEKIKSEKERLIKDKKIKKINQPLPIASGEIQDKLPDGWKWARLNTIGEFCGGGTPSKNNGKFWDGDIPWVSPKDMKFSHIERPELFVTQEALNRTNLRLIPKNSLLIVARSGILKRKLPVSVNDVPCTVNQDMKVIIPFFSGLTEYLQLMLRGHEKIILKSLVKGGMTVQSLKYKEFELRPFPIPPLAEQHRIVAKVDQLMALCDELEAKKQKKTATRISLNDAALDKLLNPGKPIDFKKHWKRIANNFDLLYDAPETVNKLRQAILQLAVQGKLVPQNPNDEPASVLLEKFKTERERLIKKGKLKKKKTLPEVKDDEKPFGLPESWEWVRLGNLDPYFQNGIASRGDQAGKEIVVLRLADIKNWRVSLENTRSLKINEKSIDRYTLKKDDLLIIRVNGSANIVGRFIICDREIDTIYCDHFIRLRFPIEVLLPSFIALLGSSRLIRKYISELFISTAGQKTVNQKHISSLLVTIPPLPEQNRIVAKVDQLMALCDDLETKLSQSQTDCDQLLSAIVNSLERGDTATTVSKNHAAPSPSQQTKKRNYPQKDEKATDSPPIKFEKLDILVAYRKAIYGKNGINDSTLFELIGQQLGINSSNSHSLDQIKSQINTAIRRKIVSKTDKGYIPATPTINHYTDDYLTTALKAQIKKKSYVYEKDSLIGEAARYLGFSIASEAFKTRLETIFQSGVRSGDIYEEGGYYGKI